MNSITNLTPQQLRKAADVKEQIDALQNELNELLGTEAPAPAAGNEKPQKRKFSAATKARMRAAQKARWTRIKGTTPESTSEEPKKKRKMTEAWRRALARAHAARRAKAKAAREARL
jgi:hypothetical protein